MQHPHEWIADWMAQDALPRPRVVDALRLAGIPPDGQAWQRWIERLLLWLGVVALLAGLIFFVAANWSGIGRFAKFALAEVAIILSLAAYCWWGKRRYSSAALLAAGLAVGALLALVGQTYQTGADTYELFLVWALLILPWTVLARLPALWMLWFVLLHVSFYFYAETFSRVWGMLLEEWRILEVIAFFDFAALAVWEWLAARGHRSREWMQGRSVPRLLALAGGFAVTSLAIMAIFNFSGDDAPGLHFVMYVLMAGGVYAAYRLWKLDLFMLAAGALSVIVTATCGLGRLAVDKGGDAGAFLLLAVFSMLATGAAAAWLLQVSRHGKKKVPDKSAEAGTANPTGESS